MDLVVGMGLFFLQAKMKIICSADKDPTAEILANSVDEEVAAAALFVASANESLAYVE
jgi:hypothetical protein